jgi:hypothetical protein
MIVKARIMFVHCDGRRPVAMGRTWPRRERVARDYPGSNNPVAAVATRRNRSKKPIDLEIFDITAPALRIRYRLKRRPPVAPKSPRAEAVTSVRDVVLAAVKDDSRRPSVACGDSRYRFRTVYGGRSDGAKKLSRPNDPG